MTNLAEQQDWIPEVRGRIRFDAPLGSGGWFRAGGSADILFKPKDEEDLAQFLAAIPSDVPVHIFGVLSNTIVRDGGLRGVTVRLGREFADIKAIGDNQLEAGSLALDANVSKFAAKEGIKGLEFFSGIPGSIGGALRMNAGCYGTETKDVLVKAYGLDGKGKRYEFTPEDMGMSYRHTNTPDDIIFTKAIFKGEAGDPEKITAQMEEIKARREDSQPIKEKTGGSTFANPDPADLEEKGLSPDTKVWQLIDTAGCRGLMVGGAQMSEKHCNFMINAGGATGSDLENLGEEVRKRVYEKHGIMLRWEIRRVGEKLK